MPFQKIVIPETLKFRSDGILQFTVSYESDDPNTTVFGFNLFFDSTVLQFVKFSNIYYRDLSIIDSIPNQDTNDIDQNPTTDQFVSASWFDYQGYWPGTTNIDLYTIKFQVQDGVNLNDFSTVINFIIPVGSLDFTEAPTNVVFSGVNQIPVITDQLFSLDENTANATIVGTLNITDADDSIDTLVLTDNSNAFDVQFIDGEFKLVVANTTLLDFETTPQFNFNVTVTDSVGESSTSNVTINLNNVNETPIIGSFNVNIDENLANNISIENLDIWDEEIASLNVELIEGNIDVDNDGNLPFKTQFNGSNWEILVNDQDDLNFEQLTGFNLTVKATDNGGLSSEIQGIVTLNNVNEAPILSDKIVTIDGTSFIVTNLNITDNEQDSLSLQVTLVAGNQDIDGDGNLPFTVGIFNQEWQIVVNDQADLKSQNNTTFNLTVKATDSEGLFSEGLVTINVNNLLDNNPPEFTETFGPFTIQEKSLTNSLVGTVSDSDQDGDILEYSIATGNIDVNNNGNLPFVINVSTGEMNVNDPNDLIFATQNSFNLTIQADDQNGGITNTNVTVNLTEINNPPEFKQTFGPFKLNEKSPNGLAIGKVTAIDSDQNDTITYSIIGGNEDINGNGQKPFTVNNIGLISVSDSEDLVYASNPSFTITIEAKDKAAITTNTNVTININEPPPQVYFNGGGNDTLDSRNITNSNGSRIRLYAGSGDDTLIANTTDRLFGGNGNDTLDGSLGEGNNLFFGGKGDDVLIAGYNDLLVGGQGKDTFKIVNNSLGNEPIIILDFEINEDKIDLSELTINDEKVNFGSLSFDESTEGRVGLNVTGKTEPIALLINISKEELNNESNFNFE